MPFINLANTTEEKIAIHSTSSVFFLWNTSKKIIFSLEKEHAEVIIFALFVGKNQEQFSFDANIIHQAPRTHSRIITLAVMDDASSSVCNGIIRMKSNATGSITSQENKNFLLSSQATAQTIPALEILTDDVSARHASVTGMPNKEALFSLESRGISQQMTSQLFTEGSIHTFFETMRVACDNDDTKVIHTIEKNVLDFLQKK